MKKERIFCVKAILKKICAKKFRGLINLSQHENFSSEWIENFYTLGKMANKIHLGEKNSFVLLETSIVFLRLWLLYFNGLS